MIELQNVSKAFFPGTANEVAALVDVSLRCAPGEWVTIVGSNGAGKSSLLKAVTGHLEIDTGAVFLDGRRVDTWPEYRRARLIGRIDQDPMASTAPNMSIEENVSMAALRGRRRTLRWALTRQRRRMIADQLAPIGMGLENRLAARVGNLSGGQRQALALVMATLAEPRILILDEHVAALDPKAAVEVMKLTERIVAAHRLCTLMVTHNMQHAIDYGDRLIMMHRGRLIYEVAGEAKRKLAVEDLVGRFHRASGGDTFDEDRALLT